MADMFILIAGSLALATCVATLVIAILRPVLWRFCGASAVLKLWWIIPFSLVAFLIPKHSPPRWLETPILVRSVAMSVARAPPAAQENLPWKEAALMTWLFGAIAMAGWLCFTQRQFTRTITWGLGRRGALPPGAGPAVVGAIRSVHAMRLSCHAIRMRCEATSMRF